MAAMALALAPACSDDTDDNNNQKDGGVQKDGQTANEAGADLAAKEAGADLAAKEAGADLAAKEAGADLAAKEAGADLAAKEAGADLAAKEGGVAKEAGTDMTSTDGTTSATETVIYSTNTSSSKYTLNQVMTDGTGQKAVAGFNANISLESIRVAGSGYRNFYPTSLTPNGVARFNVSSEYYLQLPGGKGRLVRTYDATTKGTAYALLAPGGKISTFGAGTSGQYDGVSYYVGFSGDGKTGAFIQNKKTVFLMKLDGTTFTGGKAVKDVTPSGFTGTEIYDDSLNFIGKTLYFVTNDGSSKRSLYQVPADGSKAAAKISLPTVGGKAATTIWYIAAPNKDLTHAAWLIGSSTSVEDVMVLKEGGTPVNVSKLADNLQSSSTSFQDTANPMLAMSPKGTYVAYGTTSSASANKSSFWVAKADGTGTPVMVNSSTNFASAVDTFGGYYFADEDNLLFLAGTTNTKMDLFHYKISTKALANLTKTDTATAAPWKGGKLESDAAWIPKNGKYLYFVMGEPALSTGKYDTIYKVDLTTFAGAWIGKTLYIGAESSAYADMATVAGSDNVFFVAYIPGSVQLEDLYVFNQSTGASSSLKKLTSHTGTTAVYLSGLIVSPDGKYAAYITGSSGKQTVYVVAAAGGTPVALNSTAGYIEQAMAWKQDSSGVIYGMGTTSGKLDLYVTSKDGKTSKKLHAAQSYLHVLSCGK